MAPKTIKHGREYVKVDESTPRRQPRLEDQQGESRAMALNVQSSIPKLTPSKLETISKAMTTTLIMMRGLRTIVNHIISHIDI